MILFLTLSLGFSFTACGNDTPQFIMPSNDPEKAKQGLIAAGYDEFLSGNGETYEGIREVIAAEREGMYIDAIYIFYYVDGATNSNVDWLKDYVDELKADRDAWIAGLEKNANALGLTLEELGAQLDLDVNYYINLEYGYGSSGNMAWYGTTRAIEAAQG